MGFWWCFFIGVVCISILEFQWWSTCLKLALFHSPKCSCTRGTMVPKNSQKSYSYPISQKKRSSYWWQWTTSPLKKNNDPFRAFASCIFMSPISSLSLLAPSGLGTLELRNHRVWTPATTSILAQRSRALGLYTWGSLGFQFVWVVSL